MAGQRVGYVRVSTVEQNTVRQLDGIELDRVFTDHISGATRNRPALEDLRRYVREGDTVVVHSMDRLARNLDDLRALVREFTEAGIAVEFVREHMTFTGKDSPMQQLMLSLLGAVAEFERALDPRASARGHRAGQEARRLQGPPPLPDRRSGHRTADPGRGRGAQDRAGPPVRHPPRHRVPVPGQCRGVTHHGLLAGAGPRRRCPLR